jgi:hypothetical protein
MWSLPQSTPNPSDPSGNVEAWLAEWRRVHPGLRWLIAWYFGIAWLCGISIGLVIGLLL